MSLGDPLEGLTWLSEHGFSAVQLSAAQPGMRPRELDSTARRGLRERLRRLELEPSGIDLWIPPEHFTDAAEVTRAVDAMNAAIALAEFLGRIPISCVLPTADAAPEARGPVTDEAARRGVRLADFTTGAIAEGPVGLGFDQAAGLAGGIAPMEAIARLGAALAAVRLGEHSPDGRRVPIVPGSQAAEQLLELKVALEVGGFAGIAVADARSWSDPRAGLLSTHAAWSAAVLGPPGKPLDYRDAHAHHRPRS